MSESFVNPIFGHRARSRDEPVAEPINEPINERSEERSDEARVTGNPDVDAVVATLAGLDDLPVAEHVAVFEQAHDSLRRTLTGAGRELSAGGPAAGRG